MKLCAFTDEISRDLRRAFSLGAKEGLNALGLRTVYGKRFPFYDEEDFFLLGSLLREWKLPVAWIVPGVYRTGLEQTPWEQLKQVGYSEIFRRTEELGGRELVVFGGPADAAETEYRYMEENLRKFAQRAAGRGVGAVLSAAVSSGCCTAKQLDGLWRELELPGLGVSWDPCGAFCRGALNPERDLKLLGPRLRNVRLTDVRENEGEWEFVPIGMGAVDWPRLLRLLAQSGYDGMLTLETRCLDPENAFVLSMAALRRM